MRLASALGQLVFNERLVAAVVASLQGTSRYRPRRFQVESAPATDSGVWSIGAVGGDPGLGAPETFHGISTVSVRRAALSECNRLRGAALMPPELAKATGSLKDALSGSVDKSHQTVWRAIPRTVGLHAGSVAPGR